MASEMSAVLGRAPEPKALDRFHLFPRLPAELQLMIWSFWRESQPAIRHYMIVNKKDQRCYGAYDLSLGDFDTRLSKSAELKGNDTVDPMEVKIRLTGTVKKIDCRWELLRHIRFQYRMPLIISRPYVQVNFEKDIFFCYSRSKRPGQLRALFPRIDTWIPKQIDDNNWCLRIRQLAIWLPKSLSLDRADRAALSQLRALKTIFLICDPDSMPPIVDADNNPLESEGLIPIEQSLIAPRMHHLSFDEVPLNPYEGARIKLEAKNFARKLKRVFKNNRRKVDIMIVEDLEDVTGG
ncbi:hypothetical protein AAE478_010479 [Parahypoxylon ruwenzoriense]